MDPNAPMAERAEQFRQAYARVSAEIGKVIVGHHEIVQGVLTCLFVGGHALLEGVPGLGKTLLVRTLSQVLDLKFNRVQFTPDLMPSDIIGTNIISEMPDGRRAFSFTPAMISIKIVSGDTFSACASKFNNTRCLSAGRYTLRRSSKLTLNRPSSIARTLAASTSAWAPRGLAPKRR